MYKFLTVMDYSTGSVMIYNLQEIGLSSECTNEDVESWFAESGLHNESECHFMVTEAVTITYS